MLRMELYTEERFGVVYDALIGPVVGIGEQDRPIKRQVRWVDGKPVVLGGDVTSARAVVYAGLVVSTVTISRLTMGKFKLVC